MRSLANQKHGVAPPPIEIVHFADPWCWWSWGLEPVLQRLREVYGRAAALLLTSRSEGFGRVLVEAASQGTPAVSTSLSGPRDVVINGVTGFLHEPGDIDGLTRSVSTLLSQPQRAALMGARARELVSVKFDPDTLRAAWVTLWIDTARARQDAS